MPIATPVLIMLVATVVAFALIVAAYIVSEGRRRDRLLRQRSRGMFKQFSQRQEDRS